MPKNDDGAAFSNDDPSSEPKSTKSGPNGETAGKLHEIKGEVTKNRKRPRRRRKKIDHENVKAQVFNEKKTNDSALDQNTVDVVPVNPFAGQEEPVVEPDNFVQPPQAEAETQPENPFAGQEEPVVEPDNFVQPPQAEAESQPENPFAEPVADSSLPPTEHEALKRDEARQEEAVQMEPADEGDGINPFDADLPQSEAIEPINPFDSGSSLESSIEDRALDEKPLDRIEDEGMDEDDYNEPKPVEDIGYSEEQMNESSDSEDAVSQPDDDFSEKSSSDIEAEPAEVISVESVPLSGEPSVEVNVDTKPDEVEEFKNDFWEILSQAGIEKKHLVGLLVFVLVVVGIVLFFVFGGMNLFKSDPSTVSTSEIVDEKTDDPDQTDVVETKSSEADGIVSSYIVGLENTEVQTPIQAVPVGQWGDIAGIDTALIVGSNGVTQEVRYQYYISLLRTAQNIYSTDVYALVDLSTDRRSALDAHLAEMNLLIADLKQALAEIDQIMLQLDSQFALVVADVEFYEQQYFDTTGELLSESSYNNLLEFVRSTQRSDELKAYYNGYKFVRDMYVNSLNALEPRYRDIFLNKDAVVQGVRVFDIPSSEIDAIIRLNNQ